jgi:hypothetical protein
MPKLCDYQNCRKRASYGVKRDCPIRCREHKEGMKLVSLICMCEKSEPHFNEPTETNGICCYFCKTDTMVDVKSKKCPCGKRPTFNEPTKTIGICCADCKTGTMIDIKHRKCKCGKIPCYNEPTKTIGICCADCKTSSMVNVIHRKCKCGKIPCYNEPTKTIGICCADCKTSSMINVVSKKCKCGKFPGFNEANGKKGICCADCKTSTMINVVNKKCKCGKIPCYNEPTKTIGICCVSCKTSMMVDVKSKKCIGLIKNGIKTICPYNTGGSRKYKNYCAECFRRNFPLDPLTFQIRCKTKEIAVRDFINANFSGFQHDKILETGHCDCTIRRRIDHRKLIGNTLLVIETDENQHKSYDKMDEETRYDDLFMAHSGKWIYIRFNPDKYKDKNGKSKNTMIATRMETLHKEIERQMKRIENEENTELMERIYMYYDGYD